MNRKELRDLVRIRLDDTQPQYLWSDDYINYTIDEAQREAAVRADLIIDDSITIDIVAGTSRYEFDPACRILYVDSVVLQSEPERNLVQDSINELIRRSKTTTMGEGTPVRFALDRTTDAVFRAITLLPEPVEADIVELSVKRLPYPLTSDTTILEIEDMWQMDLIDWCMALCYSVDNIDQANIDKAQRHEDRFEQRFGPRISINAMRRRQTMTPQAIHVYNPIHNLIRAY